MLNLGKFSQDELTCLSGLFTFAQQPFLKQITLNKKQNNCGYRLTQTDFIRNNLTCFLREMVLEEVERHTESEVRKECSRCFSYARI